MISAYPLKQLTLLNSVMKLMSILNIEPELPESLRKIESRTEEYISLENNYDSLKKFIIQNY